MGEGTDVGAQIPGFGESIVEGYGLFQGLHERLCGNV